MAGYWPVTVRFKKLRLGYRCGTSKTIDGGSPVSAAPLPSLPPVPGIEDDDVNFGGRSMLDLLDEAHRQLASLCERLTTPSEQEKATPRDIEDVLVATLARHLSAEEQYLYPTVKAVLPDGAPIAAQEVAADAELL